MANNIDIDIRANDKTGGVFSKIGISLASIGSAVAAFIGKAIKETTEYAKAIDEVSRSIGVNAKESSTLIQVGKDLGISQDELTTGLSNAVKKGYEPTIENLKQMQEEYSKLESPIEKSKYAVDRFGASAGKMQLILESTPDTIDRLSKKAEELGLIVYNTTEMNNYVQAWEDISDIYQSVEVRLGQFLIPYLSKVGMLLVGGKDAWKNYFSGTIWESKENRSIRQAAEDLEMLNYQLGVGEERVIYIANGYKVWVDSMGNTHRDLVQLTEDIKENTKANQTMISLTASFVSAEKSYAAGMEEATKSIENAQLNYERGIQAVKDAPYMIETLTAKLDELTASGDENSKAFKETKEKLEDWQNLLDNAPAYVENLSGKVDEQKQKVLELQEQYELETNRVILGYIQQQFMADSVLTDDEVNWLLNKGAEWGIYSETAIEKMRAVQEEWDNFDPKDKNATFTVETHYISTGMVPTGHETTFGGGYATGGYVSGGTSYLVGERGPEIFTPSGGGQITPNNQIGGGGGMSESQMTQFAKILGVAVATEIQKVSG